MRKSVMDIKVVINLKILDTEKLRNSYAMLEERVCDPYLDPLGKIVENLILNLDKLPMNVRKEVNKDDSLTCLGLYLEDSYSKLNVEKEEEYE